MRPIVCVGERLEEREAGSTDSVLEKQFAGGIAGLNEAQFSSIAIAYEPMWAIGTGKVATPEMAAAAHRCLRSLAASRYGADADSGRISPLFVGPVMLTRFAPASIAFSISSLTTDAGRSTTSPAAI